MEKPDPRNHTKRHEEKHTKFVVLFRAVSCVFVDHFFLVSQSCAF